MLAFFVKVNGQWRFEGVARLPEYAIQAMREAVEKENGPDTFRYFELEP